MRKAYFLFLLLMTLTGCSDTAAYSSERATIMQTEITTETTQNSQISTEMQTTELPPETVTSTESTPETVPDSSPAATESETTTQTCAVYAKPDTIILITEAKKAETTQETAVYTETIAVKESAVQTTMPLETTIISTKHNIPRNYHASNNSTTADCGYERTQYPDVGVPHGSGQRPQVRCCLLHFVQAATGIL